jgi:rubredoxin
MDGGAMQKYICDICLWVYDPEKGHPESGVDPNTPWEQVPEDWVCPICGVEKDKFSPFS